MKNIYFIRHAESEANATSKKGLKYELHDPPLTYLGIKQARKLGLNLQKVQFDEIWISPLKRTIQTDLFANLSTQRRVIVDLVREFRGAPSDFLVGEPEIRETHDAFLSRMKQMWDLLKKSNSKNIAVIAHGTVIKHLTGYILDNATYVVVTL